jgi:hypothetical protein
VRERGVYRGCRLFDYAGLPPFVANRFTVGSNLLPCTKYWVILWLGRFRLLVVIQNRAHSCADMC